MLGQLLSGTSAGNNHSSKETHLYRSWATDDVFKDADQSSRDLKVACLPFPKVPQDLGESIELSLSHFPT